jgi:hypothetical protein
VRDEVQLRRGPWDHIVNVRNGLGPLLTASRCSDHEGGGARAIVSTSAALRGWTPRSERTCASAEAMAFGRWEFVPFLDYDVEI